MTNFINGPQKALTIKQMFNKYNYVQMTPVNNMSETANRRGFIPRIM